MVFSNCARLLSMWSITVAGVHVPRAGRLRVLKDMGGKGVRRKARLEPDLFRARVEQDHAAVLAHAHQYRLERLVERAFWRGWQRRHHLLASLAAHARERAGLAVAGVIGHGESRMVERLIHCRSPAAGKGPVIPTVARDGNGAAGARDS